MRNVVQVLIISLITLAISMVAIMIPLGEGGTGWEVPRPDPPPGTIIWGDGSSAWEEQNGMITVVDGEPEGLAHIYFYGKTYDIHMSKADLDDIAQRFAENQELQMHAQSAGIRAHYMVVDTTRMLARWR